jgi:hypothetical protein
MDTSTTDEQRSSSSTSYHMPTIGSPSYHAATIQTADPVSPCTAVNTLLAFDDVPQDTLRELIAGLCATISKREEEMARHESAFRGRIKGLEEALAVHEEAIQDDDMPPEGYVPNINCAPNFEISMEEGVYLKARWVHRCREDLSKVEGLTGREGPGEGPYRAEIFTSAHRPPSDIPTVFLTWFLQVLQGRSSAYNILLDATAKLDDWGIAADISCYRTDFEESRHIILAINRLQAEHELLTESLSNTRAHLENFNVHRKLSGLQGYVHPLEQVSSSSPGTTPPIRRMPLPTAPS